MYTYLPPPPMPPMPMEETPTDAAQTLFRFGWNEHRTSSGTLWTHTTHYGFYTWSEALVLEVSRAFLEVSK